MKNQSCANCAFHGTGEPTSGADMAMCRRYPPQMIVMPMQSLQGMQFAPAAATPATAPGHWCGEWYSRANVIAMNQ